MWVVKIGGSLLGRDDLVQWLRVLTEHGKGKLVIVPGGGAFADTVRGVQQQFQFSDSCAHRMALKAMEQYGLLLMGLNQELVSGASEKELRHHLKAGKVPVWFPYDMVAQSPEITIGWDVTSDSLAAWLAARLGAQHLALVKCVRAPGMPVAVAEASRRGVVDRAILRFMRPVIDTWWLQASEHEGFGPILRGEELPRTRLFVLSDR
ncbi:MAG: uridylate kinase [Gammaproteobacteria bacterium]